MKLCKQCCCSYKMSDFVENCVLMSSSIPQGNKKSFQFTSYLYVPWFYQRFLEKVIWRIHVYLYLLFMKLDNMNLRLKIHKITGTRQSIILNPWNLMSWLKCLQTFVFHFNFHNNPGLSLVTSWLIVVPRLSQSQSPQHPCLTCEVTCHFRI